MKPFYDILQRVQQEAPLVHCITNTVTINDCANAALACGGRPIMADDPSETAEVTALAKALVLNTGTLHQQTIPAMFASGQAANERGIPVILDPVGAGVSRFRTEHILRLLEQIQFSVIRGNRSELNAIAHGCANRNGVDADSQPMNGEQLDETLAFAGRLSRSTGAVITVTGAADIVTDGQTAYLIRNGHPQMARITGTGCMLSTVTGVYCAANPDCLLEAAAAAVSVFGLCGERGAKLAAQSGNGIGTGSLKRYLFDCLSTGTPETLLGGMQIEIRSKLSAAVCSD